MISTFRIYLPGNAADSAETKAQRTEAIRESRGETILIVEDEPMLLELGKVMLQRLGYSVITAATPHEAIRAARENTGEIQLFITDVVMPEMTGRDLAERLQGIRPDMKCLFMSGYTADVIAHQGVLNKGVNFIQKPFSLNDLAKKIREVLN
ncbi:MAG: response regulator [Desulfosalsimonas sp.]|uniref:response regulator n=1 Tax=Desulfosalsimonas sp. TaxID=3073848 RepID=UPI003970C521